MRRYVGLFVPTRENNFENGPGVFLVFTTEGDKLASTAKGLKQGLWLSTATIYASDAGKCTERRKFRSETCLAALRSIVLTTPLVHINP